MNSQPDQDEVKFAKSLVSPEKSIRDKTLATFRKYLSSQSSFDHMEMLKVWKALYYCMWLSDKQPVQAELAQNLCDLVGAFSTEQLSLLYIRMFFRIMMREWPYLDQYRVNKFYTLVRLMFRKALSLAHQAGWSSDLASAVLNIIDEEALTKKPNGIRFHLADILLPELHTVTKGDISTKDFLAALAPFHASLLRLEDNAVFIERLAKEVYAKFATQYAAENATTAAGEDAAESKTVFAEVNTKALQKLLFDTAAAEETPNPCRKRIYDLHKQIAARTGVSFVDQTLEQLLAQESSGKKAGNGKAAATASAKDKVIGEAAAETKSKKEKSKKEKSSAVESAKDKPAKGQDSAVERASGKAVKQNGAKEKGTREKAETGVTDKKTSAKRPHSEVDEPAEAPAAAAPASTKKDKKQAPSEKTATASSATPGKATSSDSTTPAAKGTASKAAKHAEGSSPASASAHTSTSTPAASADTPPPQFIASAKFAGRKPGYMFQKVNYRDRAVVLGDADLFGAACSRRRERTAWGTTGTKCRPRRRS
jgi:ribosomal RNA-processing protein 1